MAAAAATSSLQKKTDIKAEFLTCSICTEPFDNEEHQAKYLPCLHTYCKSCLKRHAGRKPKFNCPNCRRQVTLPDKTVESLPNNFLVRNLKEQLDFINFEVSCGNCDKGNNAVSFCHDCGCFQCQKCVDSHQMQVLKDHKLSTLVELQNSTSKPTIQKHCETHPLQQLTLYCKEECCRVPACASCGLVGHQGHKLVDLATVVDERWLMLKD